MSNAAASRSTGHVADKAVLTRVVDDDAQYGGLELIGERFARGFADMLGSFGVEAATVRADSFATHEAGSWRQAKSDPVVALCYSIKPLKGKMFVIIPAATILALVDIFFGGDGNVDLADRPFSAAEQRFVGRVGDGCAAIVPPSWKSFADLETRLATVERNVKKLGLGAADDRIFVQKLSVGGAALGAATIECVYCASTLRPVQALRTVPDRDEAPAPDSAWSERLQETMMDVRLPVRSILARPEMSLAKILSLRPGDIIPLTMPRTVPLTVAGHLFAQGTVGESNGRAAIMIESVQ